MCLKHAMQNGGLAECFNFFILRKLTNCFTRKVHSFKSLILDDDLCFQLSVVN